MKKTILLFLLFCLPKLMAQQTVNASGGNATGAGGSSSYSIGQITYNEQTGSGGSINQGVQQSVEIFTLSGTAFENIKLEALVYPNPTISSVILKISNFNLDEVTYQWFDIQGKPIKSGKISNEETVFNMESYPSAIYILKINSNNKELKTFKIIKN
ncbi:T9SS type A sorting domain-containing protein [Flavobacterium amnicola]|uniref:T9SS type A sorting domain-containing protein n=1 Tax=Flavobacterium amnicola TaxID=2506422 RepID=A0A4Q1K7A4_9FLAO|nr:T9SS type A sorting domain-containing protein [Flavobacterium amnicola]RXR21134.1 T9SS type A sorting domain-containing protein [Flavobacterium amnicola]